MQRNKKLLSVSVCVRACVGVSLPVCVCACVRACVWACVRATSVRVCVCMRACLCQQGDTPVEKFNNRATPHDIKTTYTVGLIVALLFDNVFLIQRIPKPKSDFYFIKCKLKKTEIP